MYTGQVSSVVVERTTELKFPLTHVGKLLS